ncbi:MAG: hypothetical protein E7047_07810 [Lentisphaerae bacterium]|nr:hypothetical protein [Lentisphaerota bacterium]
MAAATGLSAANEEIFPQLVQAPQIDGIVSAAEWQGAAQQQLKRMGRTRGEVDKTLVWFGRDGQYLYAAFVCYDKDMANVRRQWRTPEERDNAIYNDDFVELRFDPWNALQDKTTQRQIIINANGIVYDAVNGDKSQNFTTTVQSQIAPEFWSVEIAIPLAELTGYQSHGAELWRIMLGRCNPRSSQLSSLTGSNSNAFSDSDNFLTFRSGKVEADKPFTIVGQQEGSLLWRSENNAHADGKLEQLRFDGRIIGRTAASRLDAQNSEGALKLNLHRDGRLMRFTVNGKYKYEWELPKPQEQSRTVKITQKPLYKELQGKQPAGLVRNGAMTWSHSFNSDFLPVAMEFAIPWNTPDELALTHKHGFLLLGGAGLLAPEWYDLAGQAPAGAKFIATSQYYGFEGVPVPKGPGNRPLLFDPQAEAIWIKNAVRFFKPYNDHLYAMSFGDEQTEHWADWFLYLSTRHRNKGTYPFLDAVCDEIKNKYGFGKFGPPESAGDTNVYRWIAFRHYLHDQSIRLHRKLNKTLKRELNGILLVADDPMSGQGRIYDFTDFTPEVCDIMTNQLYPENNASVSDFAFTSKYLRDLSGVQEIHPCYHIENYGATLTPLETLEKISEAYRGGANGFHWYLGDTRGQRDKRSLESDRYGAPERWQVLTAVMDESRKMNALVYPEADCGLFLPVMTARSYVGVNNRPVKSQLMHSLLELQAGAWEQIFNESSIRKNLVDLNKFKAVFVSDAKYCDGTSLEALVKYVENGGTLVITDPEAFSFDAAATPLNRASLPGLINGGNPRRSAGDRIVKCADLTLALSKTPAFDLSLAGNSSVIMSYSDGKAAAIKTPLGKGNVIVFGVNFAQRELVSDKNWQNWSRALVKDLGIKLDHDIWRFRFPKELIAAEKAVKGRCVSGNYIFFRNFLAYYGANVKVPAQAAYKCTPQADAPAEAADVTFNKGKLTDRRRAYRAGNIDGKNVKLTDRINGWQTSGEITIEFDLKQKCAFDRAEIFYAGAMRDVTVYTSSNGQNWKNAGTFAAGKDEFVKYGLKQKTLKLAEYSPDCCKVRLVFAASPRPGAIEQCEVPKVIQRNAHLKTVPWQKVNFIIAEIELWQAE